MYLLYNFINAIKNEFTDKTADKNTTNRKVIGGF